MLSYELSRDCRLGDITIRRSATLRIRKKASRQRPIELSGTHVKGHGFNESGMALLAASAGATTGALYKHFYSKADLFVALIAAVLRRPAQMYEGFDPTERTSAAKLLAGYLCLQHVRDSARGCPLPWLATEIHTRGRNGQGRIPGRVAQYARQVVAPDSQHRRCMDTDGAQCGRCNAGSYDPRRETAKGNPVGVTAYWREIACGSHNGRVRVEHGD